VFSNLRDRVENRIETVNADITIDSSRKVALSGSARRNGYPLKFEVKAALPRRRSTARTSRPISRSTPRTC
jgi:AsmA protein